MINPLKQTFGLELEYIIRYDPKAFEEGLIYGENILWPSDTKPVKKKLDILVRMHVIDTMIAGGYPVYGLYEDSEAKKWVVDTDSSIKYDEFPRFDDEDYTGMELRSPAFNLCPEALDEVRGMIELLISSFGILTNHSCGLHVHVGDQRKGFPLQTLKNFCMLTAIFETQLNSLHPPERVFGNGYTQTPVSVYEGISPWDVALLIQSCKSRKQLAVRYAGSSKSWDRNHSYNLCPLVFGERRSRTIEFRQHEATTNPIDIINWIELTCCLVNVAHAISFLELTRLIELYGFDPDFTLVQLMRELHLDLLAHRHRFRYQYYHPRHPMAWVDETLEEAVEPQMFRYDNEYVNGEKIIKRVAKAAITSYPDEDDDESSDLFEDAHENLPEGCGGAWQPDTDVNVGAQHQAWPSGYHVPGVMYSGSGDVEHRCESRSLPPDIDMSVGADLQTNHVVEAWPFGYQVPGYMYAGHQNHHCEWEPTSLGRRCSPEPDSEDEDLDPEEAFASFDGDHKGHSNPMPMLRVVN